jgi:hypothetical protein
MAARWLDSDAFLVGMYFVAALACLLVGCYERFARREGPSWPTFWFVSAAVVGAVGFARAEKLGAVISRAGTARARAEGWYAGRHHLQVDVLALLSLTWGLVVAVAMWRTRPSHRHCLPVAIAVLSLLSFLALRLVSLHEVDRVLDHRIHQVRAGSLVEAAGTALVIVLAVGTAAGHAVGARRQQVSAPAPTSAH